MGEDRCTMSIVDLQKHKVQVEFEQRTSAHLKRFFGDCGEEEDYPVSCWDGNWKAVLWGGTPDTHFRTFPRTFNKIGGNYCVIESSYRPGTPLHLPQQGIP